MSRLGARLLLCFTVLVVLLSGAPSVSAQGESAAQARRGTADWKQVSAGDQYTCGIRTNGRLTCWGWNSSGQLGIGSTSTSVPAPRVVGTATDWKSVATGFATTCAIRGAGLLYCWGVNSNGQLGIGSTEARVRPARVGTATDWRQVSVGYGHACGLRATKGVYCWGSNLKGQLGIGSTGGKRTRPAQVGTATSWTSVSAGFYATCGRRAPGRISCWGDNTDNQTAPGSTAVRNVPTQVGGATDWTAVSTGQGFTCGRRATGRSYCWGRNNYGQVGDGTYTNPRPAPTQPSGATADWSAVDAGWVNTCARKSSGRLFCWGYGDPWTKSSLLGNGTWNTTNKPVEVAGGVTTWQPPTLGTSHACARRTTGRLYCWGDNQYGQLGTGGTDQSLTPVEVS